MALKDKIKTLRATVPRPRIPSWSSLRFRLTPGVKWRLALALAVLMAAILLIVLWTSGARDTREAMVDGRRLVIRLDTGDIQGKQIMLEKTPVLPKSLNTPSENSVTAAAAPPATPKNTLMENTADGPLPVVGPNGAKPWRYYAKPFDRTGSQPVIAIVIIDLGEGKAATEAAIKLPETVTLSFSPYSRDIASWTTAARASGHEMMIDLPLQPGNYPATDPGPESLLTTNAPDINAKHLDWLMSRFAGYTGFVTPPNEAFSSDDEAFKALLKTLSSRGLMLALGGEPAKAETKQLIQTSHVPSVTADALIDEELSPTAIHARLSALEQTARDRGYAIGIARAYPLTMDQLAEWSANLKAHGVTLVPLSFIVKLRFS